MCYVVAFYDVVHVPRLLNASISFCVPMHIRPRVHFDRGATKERMLKTNERIGLA